MHRPGNWSIQVYQIIKNKHLKHKVMKTTFFVIDRQTGNKVGEYNSYIRARRVADRKDNQHGGYRYFVKEETTN